MEKKTMAETNEFALDISLSGFISVPDQVLMQMRQLVLMVASDHVPPDELAQFRADFAAYSANILSAMDEQIEGMEGRS